MPDTSKEDQAKYWQKFAEELVNSVGSGNPYNLIMAGNALPCAFNEKETIANQALYSLGATIPAWSLTWNGIYNTNFFDIYESWVKEIHPKAEDPDSAQGKKDKNDMDMIKNRIISYSNGIDLIFRNKYSDYKKEYFMDGELIPGSPSWSRYWNEYQKTPTYKNQINDLTQEADQDLDGLQSRYNTIAERYYGPNYQKIENAVTAVDKADPNSASSKIGADKASDYMMPVDVQGFTKFAKKETTHSLNPPKPRVDQFKDPKDAQILEFRPRYDPGVTYNRFKAWLESSASGEGTSLAFEVDKSVNTEDSSKYQYSGGGGFPVEDIFVVGGGTSGGGSTVDISKYDFKIAVSYDSVLYVPITPDESWYESGLLSLYKDFDGWQDGSPFKDKALWGKDGIFNIRIGGVFVGYHPVIKVTSSYWEDFTKDTHWSEHADVSLFGIISLGGESASGSTHYHKRTQIDQGFQIEDTSGVPKIVALSTEILNG